MPVEIRNPSEEELRDAMRAGEVAFAEEHKDEEHQRHRKMLPLDRFYAAYDNGRPVGTTASFRFELTIPGGIVPAAGVTWVAVQPSHRRRGILRDFMRRQLEDVHERGEPLAVLWASEAVIYGRFGYGTATVNATLDVQQTDRMTFRDDPGRQGQVSLVDAKEALELFPPVYDRMRRETPGMFAADNDWWEQYKLADPEHWRHGYSEKYYAALELDGSVEGYALYRIKQDWGEGPQGELRVIDAVATSGDATRELWRFLFGIDVVRKAGMDYFDPASPLFLMLEDPRKLRLRLSDGLWLRLVDVEQALRARSYATDESVVIEVRDELMPWNDGRWRLGAENARTDDDAELTLNVRDLASVYLGAFDFGRLAAAGRVEELKAGAVERASALFRTERPPYCSTEF